MATGTVSPEPTGEIIVTLESTERHLQYDALGVSYNSSDEEIMNAISPLILEEFGINLQEEGEEGLYTLKRVESSKNIFCFPKSTAGK